MRLFATARQKGAPQDFRAADKVDRAVVLRDWHLSILNSGQHSQRVVSCINRQDEPWLDDSLLIGNATTSFHKLQDVAALQLSPDPKLPELNNYRIADEVQTAWRQPVLGAPSLLSVPAIRHY